MTDAVRAARDDLAFLKAVAEDRGPLPAILGAHLVAVGAAFTPDLVLVWAIYTGRADWWPQSLAWATWAPGVALWLPAYLILQRRGRGQGFGPSARVFAAAWGAMGLMTVATLALFAAAQAATGAFYFQLWPAMGFVLWGGAWSVVAIIRKRLWLGAIALLSFALGVGCAALLKSPDVWLALAAGLGLVFALPGAVILRQARSAA
ncbi:hypothetical protein [uncultured Phenylobacterium sp.]|uniref:hypothetical protein n=1 Tax=uncultured Phenylobacterium sp. TaxID=349273 RepID=UPI0025DF656E|nr:hypothetical protein [uncultured Phenylobacterium sp.]